MSSSVNCVENLFTSFQMMNYIKYNWISFLFAKPLHWTPFNVRHGLNNAKRKIISRKGASVDAHEKKQTPTLSHWDSLPCNTWHLKYTFNNKKKGKTQTQGKASVCKKRQTWRVSAPMESRHVGWIDSCVYSFCSCATSVPRHNLTSWPLCWSIYHQEPWRRRGIPHMAGDSHWAYAGTWVCCSIM